MVITFLKIAKSNPDVYITIIYSIVCRLINMYSKFYINRYSFCASPGLKKNITIQLPKNQMNRETKNNQLIIKKRLK